MPARSLTPSMVVSAALALATLTAIDSGWADSTAARPARPRVAAPT